MGVTDAPVPVTDGEVFTRRASSFSSAARLLPAEVRDDVTALYAVFRRLDDLVDDGEPDARERLTAVERCATWTAAAGSHANRWPTSARGCAMTWPDGTS